MALARWMNEGCIGNHFCEPAAGNQARCFFSALEVWRCSGGDAEADAAEGEEHLSPLIFANRKKISAD
jgi:hypothetical protein